MAPRPEVLSALRRIRAPGNHHAPQYSRAFLHHTAAGGLMSNERLELLGDAVLGAAVTAHLMLRYPHESEGFISRARSCLVCGAALAASARRLGIGEALAMGGDAKPGDQALEDLLEAVIGAMFLVAGFDRTSRWIDESLIRGVDVGRRADAGAGPVDALQRRAREHGIRVATELERITGGFRARVRWEGRDMPLAVGEAANPREATLVAARRALAHLGESEPQ